MSTGQHCCGGAHPTGYSRLTTNTSGFQSAGNFLFHDVNQNGAQHIPPHSTGKNLVTSVHLAAREPGK